MEKRIEEIFKDALGKYEADVNPKVWNAVQASIVTKVALVSASTKTGNFLSNIGLKGTLWIASASIVTISGLLFVLNTNDNNSSVEAKKAATEKSNNISKPLVQKEQIITKEESIKFSPLNKIESDPKSITTNNIPLENVIIGSSSNNGLSKTLSEKNEQTASTATGSNNLAVSEASKNHDQEAKINTLHEQLNSKSNPSFSEEPFSKQQEPAFDQIENYLLGNSSINQPKLPNIFSPNHDGINDIFRLYTKGIKNLEVTVFDKIGQKIYHWTGTEAGWDGRLSNGSDAETGTYYYSVKAITEEGKICIKQSQLQLVR